MQATCNIILKTGVNSPVILGVLETITGDHLELDSIPKQTGVPKPPPFGGFEKQLITDEIVTLKSKGGIKEVSPCLNEFLSNIFLVPEKTGDMRPVVNLKPLNVFVEKVHFKMENINTALHTIAPGEYLDSLDLKDVYFSIPIFKPHHKFLRFKWSDQTYGFHDQIQEVLKEAPPADFALLNSAKSGGGLVLIHYQMSLPNPIVY